MGVYKSPLVFNETDRSPKTPKPGERALYSKGDGFYYMDSDGVESLIGSGGGGGGLPPDLLARIVAIENQQKKVSREFSEDFTTLTHIAERINVTTGLGKAEIVKSTNIVEESFDDVSLIDTANSINVQVVDGKVKLLQTETVGGELLTKNIDVSSTKQIQLEAVEYKPKEYTGSNRVLEEASKMWLAVGTDPTGKVWVFTSNHRVMNGTIQGTIYNTDGTVFRTGLSAGVLLTNYSLQFGGTVKFDSYGTAYLIFGIKDDPSMFGCMYGNGGVSSSSSNQGNYFYYRVFTFSAVGDYINLIMSPSFLPSSVAYLRSLGQTALPDLVQTSNGLMVVLCPVPGCMYSYNHTSTPQHWDMLKANQLQLFRRVNGVWEFHSTFSTVTGGASSNDIRMVPTQFMFRLGDVVFVARCTTVPPSDSGSLINFTTIKLNIDGSVATTNVAHSIPATKSPTLLGGSLGGLVFSEFNNHLYSIRCTLSGYLTVTKYLVGSTNFIEVTSKSYQLSVKFGSQQPMLGRQSRFLVDGGGIHVTYMGTTDGTSELSLRYMYIGYDCDLIVGESLVYLKQGLNIETHEMAKLDGKLVFFHGSGVFNGLASTHQIDKSTWLEVPSDITYEILNFTDNKWYPIDNGGSITMAVPTTSFKLRAKLTSPQFKVSPTIDNIRLSCIEDQGGFNLSGEVKSTQLFAVSSSGRGILSADYDLNEGSIDWAVSYNGGTTWNDVLIGEEFLFNFTTAPNFRVRATLSIEDETKISPVIRSYTLRTDSVVLHSDIEELQINLMKTNFKIDSYTNASKNGLLKMSVDVFSNANAIDGSKSVYNFSDSTKSVGGDYIVTLPDVVIENVTSVLLTTDEILPGANDFIYYMVSVDGGLTFSGIPANVKTSITKLTTLGSTLVFKAVFNGNARLSAWAWAWN